MPTSNFGYFPSFDQSSIAESAKALQTLATPDGVTFSNGTNYWRIRMETDNNLTFAYSTDSGVTYTVYHIFTPS